MEDKFDYHLAFSRNLGWVTSEEQSLLRGKRVAIAGMGGVGGFHLLAMLRLGIEKFNIADFDRFELANFNRQAGATVSTIGEQKVEVLANLARGINTEADVRQFPEGINEDNLSEFLTGADLYVDGLDFFAFRLRERVFDYCARKGIPAITVAPLGMSAALISFVPGSMSFEDYFQLAGQSDAEKAVRFLVGLAPGMLHRTYLMDRKRVDLSTGKGPSTVIACHLCAGIACAEALKVLLQRGKVLAAPHAFQFDAFRNKLIHTWRPGGNRHPINRLAVRLAKRQLGI